MGPLRMVPMASLPPFQARVLAARLGAEGILWQLRGESSVYPFAMVDVLVEVDEVERARELLDPSSPDADTAVSLVESTMAESPEAESPEAESGRRWVGLWAWLVIVVVLVGLALRISHLG